MPQSMQQSVARRVLLLFVCVCSVPYAQTQVAKVTKIKPEDYGWQPLPKEQRSEWGGTSSQLVSIDHRGRVLVGFTVRENYGLATREHPGFSFHILRFTSEGKVDLSLVLPTNNLVTNGLYLGPNDQIFARANDTLQWTSEEDATSKSVQIGGLSCHVRRTVISVSRQAVAL